MPTTSWPATECKAIQVVTMYRRHLDVPVYAQYAHHMPAPVYNRARLALTRQHGAQIRLALPGLKTLDFILQSDAWIIVDHAFNDIPVLAWSDFASVSREALHVPVDCQLRLYHAHAAIVAERTLSAMVTLLAEQDKGGHAPGVIDFPR